jgi:hypothetical protein
MAYGQSNLWQDHQLAGAQSVGDPWTVAANAPGRLAVDPVTGGLSDWWGS